MTARHRSLREGKPNADPTVPGDSATARHRPPVPPCQPRHGARWPSCCSPGARPRRTTTPAHRTDHAAWSWTSRPTAVITCADATAASPPARRFRNFRLSRISPALCSASKHRPIASRNEGNEGDPAFAQRRTHPAGRSRSGTADPGSRRSRRHLCAPAGVRRPRRLGARQDELPAPGPVVSHPRLPAATRSGGGGCEAEDRRREAQQDDPGRLVRCLAIPERGCAHRRTAA